MSVFEGVSKGFNQTATLNVRSIIPCTGFLNVIKKKSKRSWPRWATTLIFPVKYWRWNVARHSTWHVLPWLARPLKQGAKLHYLICSLTRISHRQLAVSLPAMWKKTTYVCLLVSSMSTYRSIYLFFKNSLNSNFL